MSGVAEPFKQLRLRRWWIVAPIVGALVTVGCNTVASRFVDYEDKHAARNPNGIMIGAEDRYLGDPSSPNAALFVHGFAGAGTNFNQLPQRFADAGWYVRVMRLPGHGTSPRDLANVTACELENAVYDAAAELRRHRERVVLVGHSMGGSLCTLAASHGNVDGLILGGAYFGVTYKWYYVLPPERWTKAMSPLIHWVYKGGLFTQINDRAQVAHIVSYTWLPTKAGIQLSVIGRDVNKPNVLERITCPVLIFHSHGDAAASPKATLAAYNRMRSSDKELVWIDRSNHHVFWDYDRDSVLAQSMRFLEKIKRQPAHSLP